MNLVIVAVVIIVVVVVVVDSTLDRERAGRGLVAGGDRSDGGERESSGDEGLGVCGDDVGQVDLGLAIGDLLVPKVVVTLESLVGDQIVLICH